LLQTGAFYTCGQQGTAWSNRGNVLRNSVFKRIRNTTPFHLGDPSVQAVYLDDQISGWDIYNNTFIDSHVGICIGGGRDNLLHGNSCPSTVTCVHVDNRGQNWEQTSCNVSVCGTKLPTVGGCDPLGLEKMMAFPAWQAAFPELKGALPDPCTPVGNVVTANTFSAGQFIDQPRATTDAWKMTVHDNKKV
jgi:hypothetical protein